MKRATQFYPLNQNILLRNIPPFIPSHQQESIHFHTKRQQLTTAVTQAWLLAHDDVPYIVNIALHKKRREKKPSLCVPCQQVLTFERHHVDQDPEKWECKQAGTKLKKIKKKQMPAFLAFLRLAQFSVLPSHHQHGVALFAALLYGSFKDTCSIKLSRDRVDVADLLERSSAVSGGENCKVHSKVSAVWWKVKKMREKKAVRCALGDVRIINTLKRFVAVMQMFEIKS